MARADQRTALALFRPFERFFRLEASGSIILLAAAVTALAWANSPARASYDNLWHTHAVVGVGAYVLDESLLHWVNDALMAIFFLLVGLEIKRELMSGELSTRKAALLPVVGALGGMVVPALIYVALNWGEPTLRGWGIPMATDIAFALGALAILGRRLPPSLRVFLAAAAIVDDIGAVLVIAVFYTPEVSLVALAAAAAVLGLLFLMNRLGVRSPAAYILVGVPLWLAVFHSGVHATVAGVLLAFTIPATARRKDVGPQEAFEGESVTQAAARVVPHEREAALLAVEKAAQAEEATLYRMEHALVPWVSYGIMPIFALANAGVALEGSIVDALSSPVALGIILGLVVGKQIGIVLFPWMAIRLGLASLPTGATWRHMYGVAWLAGIGFTMSLFIAGLALPADLEDTAKLGILTASVIAGVGGTIVLVTAPRAAPQR